MAHEGGEKGVLIRSNTQSGPPLPCDPKEGKVVPMPFGSGCFYADPGKARQWVQILVLNRENLSFVSNSSIDCPSAPTPNSQGPLGTYDPPIDCMIQLGHMIQKLTSGDLVIAVNQPGSSADEHLQPPVGVGWILSGGIERTPNSSYSLGVDAKTWYEQAHKTKWKVHPVRGTFSAIGVPHWTSHGLLSMPDHPTEQGKGSLTADLAVDNTGLYSPVTTVLSPEDKVKSPITGVLIQAPKAWPHASNGEKEAISAIGKEVGLGPDPRAQYYSSLRTRADWHVMQGRIGALNYSELPSPTFDKQDFQTEKDELVREIGYLMEVDRYTQQLALPLQGTSQTLWSSFNSVWQHVDTATSNGNNAGLVIGIAVRVLMTAVSVVGASTGANRQPTQLPSFFHNPNLLRQHLIGLLVRGSVKAGSGIVLGAYAVASHWASSGSGAAGASFSTVAADYGQQLAVRLNAADKEISSRWRNIIVADYGKLKTVADCASGGSDCRLPGNWRFSVNDAAQLERALKLAYEADLYTSLVPAKYSLRLALVGSTDVGGKKYPESQSVAKDLSNFCALDPPFRSDSELKSGDRAGTWVYEGDGHWNVDVLTNKPAGIHDPWKAASEKVFEKMFDPLDKGGLGIDEATFMKEHWPSKNSKKYQLSTGVKDSNNYNYPIGFWCNWQ